MRTPLLLPALALSTFVGCRRPATSGPVASTAAAQATREDVGRLPYLRVLDNFKRIQFDTDSASLDPRARRELRRVSRILQDHPQVRLAVIGHADERGDRDDNKRLALYRARAVKAYLKKRGMPRWQVDVRSAGEARRGPCTPKTSGMPGAGIAAWSFG